MHVAVRPRRPHRSRGWFCPDRSSEFRLILSDEAARRRDLCLHPSGLVGPNGNLYPVTGAELLHQARQVRLHGA